MFYLSFYSYCFPCFLVFLRLYYFIFLFWFHTVVFVLSCLFIVLAAPDLASATLCLINFFFLKVEQFHFFKNLGKYLVLCIVILPKKKETFSFLRLDCFSANRLSIRFSNSGWKKVNNDFYQLENKLGMMIYLVRYFDIL